MFSFESNGAKPCLKQFRCVGVAAARDAALPTQLVKSNTCHFTNTYSSRQTHRKWHQMKKGLNQELKEPLGGKASPSSSIYAFPSCRAPHAALIVLDDSTCFNENKLLYFHYATDGCVT